MSTVRNQQKAAPLRSRAWVPGVALAMAVALTGCGGAADGLSSSGKFVVGYQQGLGSAPLLIVEESGCMKEAAAGTAVEFTQFNSGAAIRDSMLANRVQAGGVGLAPFLIGADKGIDWKILAAQNNMDFRLMASDPKFKSLTDFGAGDQIAVPAPDSIQAIVLRKAAAMELGDANALEENMVSMGHPNALQALLTGQVAGHMASAPFSYTEKDKGAHRVTDSKQVFKQPINNTVVAVRQSVQKSVPEVTQALKTCIGEAIDILNNDRDRAAQLLEASYEGKQSAESIKADLTHEDLVWPADADGVELVASFMQEIGMIDDVPTLADVTNF